MTESSPEPLDDLYEERIRRPVVRWQSMKEDGKDSNGLRRTETLPEMRPGRRGGRRRLRPRNNNGSIRHFFKVKLKLKLKVEIVHDSVICSCKTLEALLFYSARKFRFFFLCFSQNKHFKIIARSSGTLTIRANKSFQNF